MHVRFEDPCRIQGTAYDATAISKLRAAGAIPFGRSEHGRVRDGLVHGKLGISDHPQSRGTRHAFPVAQAADPLRLWRHARHLRRSAATPEVRSASLRLFAGRSRLEPSYGRVSRYGLVAFASSLDQIGPFARSTRDCAAILNAIAGKDPRDSTSLDLPQEDFTAGLGRDLKGVKLGIPKEYFVDGMDGRIREKVEAAIRQCESLGAELVEVSLPHTEYAVGVYYIIATAEASANLARFDGAPLRPPREKIQPTSSTTTVAPARKVSAAR